jgi:hypothetical protein
MLTLKQIKLVINNLLLNKFPTIEIQSEDVRQGFNRPCFFVQLDNDDRDTRLYVTERSILVRIHYFPTNRYEYSLEIMDIQDGLESIFNLNFKVETRVITINETRAQTIDGVLEFEFDFEFVDPVETIEEGDLMGDLELDV